VKVAVVGSYGVGMTMRLPRVPVAGETLLGGEFSAGHGGKGSNQAVAAARLGAEVTLLTCVGDDAMGRDAHALWSAEGVDATVTRTAPGVATMVGMILVEPSGENRIVIAAGALNHLRPEHLTAFRPHIAAADIAVVSLEIPLDTAVAALRLAREAGTPTLLNPAPAQPLPDEAWGLVDVVTPNRTEAAILLGHDPGSAGPAATLAAALHERGAATVVVTLGGDGAHVHARAGGRMIPAARPRADLDTTGAGDAFTAALAVELAAGRPTDDAVRVAARVGAHVVGIPEVLPALPRRAELDALEETP
jgi:ribokinase